MFPLLTPSSTQMSLTKDADESFIKMLSKEVKPVMFRRGDFILRKHDMGSEVYFIHQGRVSKDVL